jgi:diguanylate cyclase (GGDEF)-like protein/PAS domain S-box-containing protein
MIRLLLVEDSEDDATLAVRMLERAGLRLRHERGASAAPMRAALARQAWDAVISDYRMPGFSGLEALAIARESGLDIPFILISGTIGEELAVQAMKAGASDYVMKRDLSRLAPALERELQEAAGRAAQRRTERELGASEERLRTIIATEPECVKVVSAEGTLLEMNPAGLAMLEAGSLAEAQARPLIDFVLSGHRGDFAAMHRRVMRGEKATLEFEIEGLKGGRRWLETHAAPLRGANGEGTLLLGVTRDITERREAEAKIRRLNRVYALLSGINALIVRVRGRDELFRDVCRIAVESGGFRMAWIGVVEREAKRVKPSAWHRMDIDYVGQMPHGQDPADEAHNGLAGRPVTEGRAVVTRDMTMDPRVRLQAQALERGVRSLVMLPVPVGSEALAVLGLYAAEAEFFDEQEMKLLHELAGDIAFALDHIEKSEKVDYLAYYDTLTGLANRSLFHERLGHDVLAARSAGQSFALLILNVDRFKTVNDAYGRRAGDRLLRKVAQRLEDELRETAHLARTGADSFAVVAPGARSEADTARFAERLLHAGFGRPFRVGEDELRASARIGIAVFPADGADGDALFHNAEAAMKMAKAGGEKYLFYAPAMSARIAEKLSLETQLRRALENDEFVLHYQPKVDTATRAVAGMEALIRWQSAERGLVPPMQFIPLLEETGLILEVGSWALRRAALDHRAWTERRLGPPRVAVNVSPIQLRQRDFVQRVERAIMEGVAPVGIDLEITESLIMADIEETNAKLGSVRGLGLNIAIDDFGTGYSSLAYLAKLPVQSLKIDRSFIVGMLAEAHTMTLVQTIISLAHSLKLRVVAEGVDDAEQANMLRLLRCDELQGYLFSRPVPFDEMTGLLDAAAKKEA